MRPLKSVTTHPRKTKTPHKRVTQPWDEGNPKELQAINMKTQSDRQKEIVSLAKTPMDCTLVDRSETQDEKWGLGSETDIGILQQKAHPGEMGRTKEIQHSLPCREGTGNYPSRRY